MDPDLPGEIRFAFRQSKELQERLPQILKVYHTLKDHPCFTPAAFREKLDYCIRYPHQKPAFGAYLHRALLNEWNNKPRKRKLERTLNHESTDLPEWVKVQAERYAQPNQPQNNELTPEQKAEIDRLLKALEEV